ncbi:MAG: CPBP family intramembrane metalloprotease [Clostridiales bacterium]|nr:CPBP family intramembrane metalloprotease [Clostridiales bacterium]
MNEKILKRTTLSCIIIFALMIAVHAFEAIVLRTDETILGENFINKVFGIVLVFIVLKLLNWRAGDIGFARRGLVKNASLGLLLAIPSFAVSYLIEILILKGQGQDVSLGIFTSGFSLTGNAEIHTGIGFILMCIFFNIINVVMEEGTFRGLFYHITGTDHSRNKALMFQALLFGIWHIVTPLHNLIDGDMNVASFIGLSLGYIILAGMMGIKWALLYNMTGSLYAGMADHFFNNCIATNLLHVTTSEGTDDMMIVRVLIAQLISFGVVILIWKRRRSGLKENGTVDGTCKNSKQLSIV